MAEQIRSHELVQDHMTQKIILESSALYLPQRFLGNVAPLEHLNKIALLYNTSFAARSNLNGNHFTGKFYLFRQRKKSVAFPDESRSQNSDSIKFLYI